MRDEEDGTEPFDFDHYQAKEQAEILYRLDERTERMDGRIQRMDSRAESQLKILQTHDDRIQRNTTILNAITFGLGSLVAAIMTKLGGFLKFL